MPRPSIMDTYDILLAKTQDKMVAALLTVAHEIAGERPERLRPPAVEKKEDKRGGTTDAHHTHTMTFEDWLAGALKKAEQEAGEDPIAWIKDSLAETDHFPAWMSNWHLIGSKYVLTKDNKIRAVVLHTGPMWEWAIYDEENLQPFKTDREAGRKEALYRAMRALMEILS